MSSAARGEAAARSEPSAQAGGRDHGSKGAQTRQAVLDAAIERFGRDGFRVASVAEIARDADVGGTVPYTYFANKEALFDAALDADAAAVIDSVLPLVLSDHRDGAWREPLFFALLDAVEEHPLTRRVLAGLEPHVTPRMLELPALVELRETLTERLRADQAAGVVRPDVDPAAMGRGAVTVFICILLAAVQFGREGLAEHAPDVTTLFAAAFDPIDPSP